MVASVGSVPYIALDRAAVAASVGDIRRALADFAAEHGADLDTLHRVRLAVSEAVNNAVMHAFATPGGTVRVAADVEDEALEIVVSDDGLGFTPRTTPGTGLGLVVIERCCDAFLVREQVPHGVEVWMRFDLIG